MGSIPGSERSSGEGNGNPLQYSCLDNPMHRGAWRATIHRVARVRHDLVTKQHDLPLGCLMEQNSFIFLSPLLQIFYFPQGMYVVGSAVHLTQAFDGIVSKLSLPVVFHFPIPTQIVFSLCSSPCSCFLFFWKVLSENLPVCCPTGAHLLTLAHVSKPTLSGRC